MRHISLFTLLLCATTSLPAQERYDTLSYWSLTQYSTATINNLAADATNWALNSKGGRYQNVTSTTGELLKANGVVIAETDGLYFPAGLSAGQILICYNRGSANGVQMQGAKAITIKGLKAGQLVDFELRSSSSAANGIKSVSNLSGDYGTETYVGPNFKEYHFTVVEDGDVSWTNSGGVIYRNVVVRKDVSEYDGQVAAPVISVSEDHQVTLTSATEGAEFVYTTVDHGTIQDYPQTYTGPFALTHSVRLRAQATKTGMKASEVTEQYVTVPLSLPYQGRPFRLDPEPLDRGLIVTKATGGWLVNWRRLIDDPRSITFKVYRNGTLISADGYSNTNILDTKGSASAVYTLETLDGETVLSTDTALMLTNGYWDIPLDLPADSSTQSGEFKYVPGDCMVADLDGDHTYEVVMKWDPANLSWDGVNPSMVNDTAGTAGQKDNSLSGYTGPVLIDAYKLDGTKLWRINLGRNIRAGAHYTQLMVYDLDQDGRAEVACKTAPGTIDGNGKPVLMDGDDASADYRGSSGSKTGVVITGPEYLTVFDGLTGAERATTHYRPSRDTTSWGDTYGNRSERYLACVAYLDGKRPSLVMCRGYYTAAYLWAVDFDGQKLSTRWLHCSDKAGYGAYGEGAHGISVADLDGDLCDEIVYGSCALDNDGSLLYRTGLGHGDALHVGDLDPDRNGLEVMMVHEETSALYGVEMHDALTGEHLSGVNAGSDVGRGLCADIDANNRGCEYWSTLSNDVYNTAGVSISTKRPSVNFRTYWDGDLQEELTEKGAITKWRSSGISTLVDMRSKYKAGVNLIKYTPCLQADIFGDWREEQIYYDNATRAHLWIFSTPYKTDYSIPTLMHDHQYRMATVWQTSAYNQPPHLSYYLPDYVTWLEEETDIRAIETDDPCNPGGGQVSYRNLLGQPVASPDGPAIAIDRTSGAARIVIVRK